MIRSNHLSLKILLFAIILLIISACRPQESAVTAGTDVVENGKPGDEGTPGSGEEPGDDPGNGETPGDDDKEPGDNETPGDDNEKPGDDGETPGDDGETPGDPQEENPMIKLFATSASGSAYSVIQSAGFDYESPDQLNGGHSGTPHIIQQYDDILRKNVFAFVMHHGVDRNATGDWTRQRVEIKIDHRNNSAGRNFCGLGGADEGRSFIHRWKFKLPADFALSNQFTHIHQIKNEGGDASQPVAALTARANNSNDRRMQLTYYAPASSSPVYWVNTANSLDAYLGRWVQCEERITYSSDASIAAYSLKITRIDDDQILMNYTAPSNIYTWREGNTHGRPKFGLYRRIFTGSSPGNNTEPSAESAVSGLKDETVLFADFEVERLK